MQFHPHRGQGLATGDHHVAATQGDHVGFQLFQFGLAGGNALAHSLEFSLIAADLGVAALHVTVEPLALALQPDPLPLKRLQFLAQAVHPSLGRAELLLHLLPALHGLLSPLLGLSAALFRPLHVGTAAGQLAAVFFQVGLAARQGGAAVAQAGLDLIQLKQSHSQLVAHQKHQAEGDRADQAAREGRDHHGGLAGSEVEEAEPGLAHLAAQPVAEGGEHAAEHQQRHDQQPARHALLQYKTSIPEERTAVGPRLRRSGVDRGDPDNAEISVLRRLWPRDGGGCDPRSAEPFGQGHRVEHGDFLAVDLHQTVVAQVSE